MAVHYVGGEPTRITCYTQRKNVNRWLCKEKPKLNWPSVDVIFDCVSFVVSVVAVIAFVAMWFI